MNNPSKSNPKKTTEFPKKKCTTTRCADCNEKNTCQYICNFLKCKLSV